MGQYHQPEENPQDALKEDGVTQSPIKQADLPI